MFPWEAVIKQKKIEQEEMKASIKPLKEKFARELIASMEKLKIEGKEIPSVQMFVDFELISAFNYILNKINLILAIK